MPFRVMFVCFGNICRSPMAEALFLDAVRAARREDDFEAASAATGCEEGRPVHPGTVRVLAEHGKKPHGLVSALVYALGLFRVLGHIPCLSREKSAGDPALGTIVPDAALGHAPLLGGLRNRNETHITPHFPRSGRLLRRLDITPLICIIIITRHRQKYNGFMLQIKCFLPITAKYIGLERVYSCILPITARKNGTHGVPSPRRMHRVRDQAFAFFHASTLALLIWVSFSAVYLDSAPPLV